MIDKHPALIARCQRTADVVAAVNFAREHQLVLAVRGGGHNAAGNATCDDGLVIDLSPMRAIEVDPQARIAHAQGGATWADLDSAAHRKAHAAATPAIKPRMMTTVRKKTPLLLETILCACSAASITHQSGQHPSSGYPLLLRRIGRAVAFPERALIHYCGRNEDSTN